MHQVHARISLPAISLSQLPLMLLSMLLSYLLTSDPLFKYANAQSWRTRSIKQMLSFKPLPALRLATFLVTSSLVTTLALAQTRAIGRYRLQFWQTDGQIAYKSSARYRTRTSVRECRAGTHSAELLEELLTSNGPANLARFRKLKIGSNLDGFVRE